MAVQGSINIGDVARRLGVAKGTVSRALNGYSDISTETRSRVLALVDEIGYRPSSLARSLKKGRVETVGIVLPTSDNQIISGQFLSEFLDGLSQGLGQNNHDLLVATAASSESSIEVYERLLASSKVDGIIVTRTQSDDPRITYLLKKGVPFVAHGRTRNSDKFAWYDIDNAAAFKKAVLHLVTLGHQRIAFLGAPTELNFARLRLEGFKNGMSECDLDIDPALVVERTLEESAGYQATKEFLQLNLPPTAILCAVDTLAVGAIKAIREFGLTIGSDITVIGYDGAQMGAHLETPLTTLSQSMAEAGMTVADMLLAVINGDKPENHQKLGEASLLRRASDGPPRLTPRELSEAINLDQISKGGT